MSRNFEIPENLQHAEGASLQVYSPEAYDLARAALQPEDTESLTMLSPPGFLLVKKVEERDAVHYVIPGIIARGMQTEWSGGEVVRSRKLWTPPGVKELDTDGHPNLLLDVPLVNLPAEIPKPPRGTWMGLEVDESALTRGLVHLVPIRQEISFKPFDAASYISHLLKQNR